MSFIIQGIDLPKGYKALHMRVQSNGVVRYVIEGDDPVHIIDGARAIQIPKGHGDIKDVGKELVELQTMKVEGEEFTTAVNFAIDCLHSAPTILESEE